MGLNELVSSTGWKNFIAKLYGFGASIVIIGALFKIQHWPFAGVMLTVGLMTEAIIFFFSAFEPLHEEVDWSLVYPELAGLPAEDKVADHGTKFVSSPGPQAAAPVTSAPVTSAPVSGGVVSGGVVTGGVTGTLIGGFSGGGNGYGGGNGSAALSKFDEMLVEADITPELFKNLGVGMKKLGEATSNIQAMNDVSQASNNYLNTINSANESLGNLSESYKTTTQVINETGLNYKNIAESLSVIEVGGKSYQEQIESLNKNLAALNTVYELQRKGADDHVKESSELYKELQALVKDLADSADETKKYREQVTKLNDNLSALNNVYGNMLAASNVK